MLFYQLALRKPPSYGVLAAARPYYDNLLHFANIMEKRQKFKPRAFA